MSFMRQLVPPKAARPWLYLAVLIFVGVMLIFLGAARTTPSADKLEWTEWLWTQAGRIGDLMVVGGVFGVVTKLLVMTGAFREGLIDAFKTDEFRDAAKLAAKQAICGASENDPPDPAVLAVFAVAFHDETIEEQWLDRRADLRALWGRLTRRVYLPHLNVSARGQGSPEVRRLADKIEGAVHDLLNYDNAEDYHRKGYLKDLVRNVDVEWHDHDKTKISIIERQSYSMIPFDPSNSIRLISIRIQQNRIDFVEDNEEYKINGESPQLDNPVVSENNGITTEKVEHILEGSTEYGIFKRRKLSWLIDIEPIY
jgi:hypothetical protein